MPPGLCLCEDIPRVETRTRIVIVRHAREIEKPSGTSRVAALALPALSLIDYRDEIGAAPEWIARRSGAFSAGGVEPPAIVGARLAELEGATLLFPTGRAASELSAPPRTLVVLDGTWRQVRAMYQRIPGVARLPAVRLSAQPVARARLRREVREGDRSTLEAIADALAELEGEAVAAPLHALHARFVARHLATRGR
jgi:DTW domain-containing protein YfiP